ncbi:9813_t:CDS:2, partial [Cetraspora pellucida]
FLEEALSYVIRCHEEDPSRHLFCTPKLTEITTEMLPLFAVPDQDSSILHFRQIIEEELKHCFSCVEVFHTEKKQLYNRFSKVYINEKLNVDKFFSNLKKWIKSRVCYGLEVIKLNLKYVNPIQLIGMEISPNSARITTAFLETLLDPFLLIGLNNLFVDILVHFKANESFKLTHRYLPGVLILMLHERAEVRNWARTSLQGMTKTLEMKEFQSCAYFSSSVQAILQKLKGFNDPPDKTTIQFILTKDLVDAWEGVKLILSVIDQNIILRNFFERDLNIIQILYDNLQSSSNIDESVFIELLGCLEILLDKIGSQFWDHISCSHLLFFQSLFTTYSSIRSNPLSSKKLYGIFIKFLQKLRQTFPDIEPSERLEETASEKTITMSILTESQNIIEDIYIKWHSSIYDNGSILSTQLRGILWINVLIETFEILISSDEYYVEMNVLLFKCIHKIALMDIIEMGRHHDNVQLTFFIDLLNKLREQIDRFLKKLCNEDSKIIPSILPIEEVASPMVCLLFSTNGEFMIESLTLLKKLYPINTYIELVQRITVPIIEGIIGVLHTFAKWTEIGCDTFKLAGSIQQLLSNAFFLPIFGDWGISKNQSLSQDINLLIHRYWDASWCAFTQVFKKYDDSVSATIHDEVIIQLSSYVELATHMLQRHSDPAFGSIDSLSLTDPFCQALKYIIGLVECNNRDLIQKLHRLTCEILYVLTTYELTMDSSLYVKLVRVSNEGHFTVDERNELNAALSKHVTNGRLLETSCDNRASSYMSTSTSLSNNLI